MRQPVRHSHLQERRKAATLGFRFRVFVLVLLIGGLAYGAWFAKWTRPIHTALVRIGQ